MTSKPEIGDIVCFMARAHPLSEPYEIIGRVERDARGLHAGNRYLPMDGVRIVERFNKTEKENGA
jgi:hypothetical protein